MQIKVKDQKINVWASLQRVGSFGCEWRHVPDLTNYFDEYKLIIYSKNT